MFYEMYLEDLYQSARSALTRVLIILARCEPCLPDSLYNDMLAKLTMWLEDIERKIKEPAMEIDAELLEVDENVDCRRRVWVLTQVLDASVFHLQQALARFTAKVQRDSPEELETIKTMLNELRKWNKVIDEYYGLMLRTPLEKLREKMEDIFGKSAMAKKEKKKKKKKGKVYEIVKAPTGKIYAVPVGESPDEEGMIDVRVYDRTKNKWEPSNISENTLKGSIFLFETDDLGKARKMIEKHLDDYFKRWVFKKAKKSGSVDLDKLTKLLDDSDLW